MISGLSVVSEIAACIGRNRASYLQRGKEGELLRMVVLVSGCLDSSYNLALLLRGSFNPPSGYFMQMLSEVVCPPWMIS
uniref:Uncharacterized protein n=1 Tax=Ralstonia syzygii R24 TaxID=907261 RepID=G3A7H4_9RALS|nr:hypothetical protein RALSY_40670 [Ralstonia syzygii R24]